MQMAETMSGVATRPYRSHKIPACDLCRQRKTACKVDIPGQPCRLCRERGLRCHFSQRSEHRSESAELSSPSRRWSATPARPAVHLRDDVRATSTSDVPTQGRDVPVTGSRMAARSSVLLNPPMSEDVEALEQYLHGKPTREPSCTEPYRVLSHGSGNPMVYLKVPRHRRGLPSQDSPGEKQLQIIEQVLGSSKEAVVGLYLELLHPCFPILGNETVEKLRSKDVHSIEPALMCDIYAAALHFWKCSGRLSDQLRPDLAFIWNQAVTALQDDFLGPSMSTIQASLLDLIGRPVLSITGNVGTIGRTVALAQSFGLHRHPASSTADELERVDRSSLWWGTVVHDHWSSLAHGTPPLIQARNFDVSIPSLNHSTSSRQQSAASFGHLCALTRVLGGVLPLVYDLNIDQDQAAKQIRRLECALDDWENDATTCLQTNNPSASTNGAATQQDNSPAAEAKAFHLATMREAASRLVDFVANLSSAQLNEFWLPYTAHILVSATTILLRCIIESKDITTKQICARKLVWLLHKLSEARDQYDWDLADFCLERCSESIRKIATALRVYDGSGANNLSAQVNEQTSNLADVDFLFGIDGFDMTTDPLDWPFDSVWAHTS